jgi:hypothetical protein
LQGVTAWAAQSKRPPSARYVAHLRHFPAKSGEALGCLHPYKGLHRFTEDVGKVGVGIGNLQRLFVQGVVDRDRRSPRGCNHVLMQWCIHTSIFARPLGQDWVVVEQKIGSICPPRV